jgi:hypothetical protein
MRNRFSLVSLFPLAAFAVLASTPACVCSRDKPAPTAAQTEPTAEPAPESSAPAAAGSAPAPSASAAASAVPMTVEQSRDRLKRGGFMAPNVRSGASLKPNLRLKPPPAAGQP